MSEVLRPLVVAWWSWIAPLSLQAAVVILAVAVLDRLLPRRTWPQLRAALWILALLRLVLPPSLSSPWSLTRWLPLEIPLLETVPAAAPSTVTSWAYGVFFVWLGGLALLAGWGVVRYRRLRRAWRRAGGAPTPAWLPAVLARASARLGLRQPPPVRISPSVPVPFVVGTLSPEVFLPADLGEEEAEHALLHELAHIRRRDTWLAAATAALQLLYWFHPLVWLARRRLEVIREQCCDRTVTQALGGDAAGYRRTLLRFAARRLEAPAGSLGFVRPRSALLTRLFLLEQGAAERPWFRRAATTLLCALLAVACLPVAREADRQVTAVAELMERPPGCMLLRYEVLRRLAEERRSQIPDDHLQEEIR